VIQQQPFHQPGRPSDLHQPFEAGQSPFDLVKDETEHLVLGH
jgi:hypothetical protein